MELRAGTGAVAHLRCFGRIVADVAQLRRNRPHRAIEHLREVPDVLRDTVPGKFSIFILTPAYALTELVRRERPRLGTFARPSRRLLALVLRCASVRPFLHDAREPLPTVLLRGRVGAVSVQNGKRAIAVVLHRQRLTHRDLSRGSQRHVLRCVLEPFGSGADRFQLVQRHHADAGVIHLEVEPGVILQLCRHCFGGEQRLTVGAGGVRILVLQVACRLHCRRCRYRLRLGCLVL